MDVPSEFRNPGKRKSKKGGLKPQLYEDTSMQPPPQQYGAPPGHGYNPAAYGGQPGMGQFPGSQYLNDPMTNMAMQYGQSLAGQSTEFVHKNIEKYVATSRLKYYFAVDTAYVVKKLRLLCFPFTQSDWSIKFNQDQPVAPRDDCNAPDLYIPSMAFVTYILIAGVVLGTYNKFTPEQLGIQTSSALVWLILELFVLNMSLYIMNLKTDLKYLDILAYCGYKFVGMILCLLGGMLFQSTGYYVSLLWFSITIAFFLVQTLRVKILPHSDESHNSRGSKRSLYLILSMSLLQPVMMWWLTGYIMFAK
ncbi:protein YIF1B-A-like isoform X2 [Ostrea edulis]|uniref:protein YIF1B-A-like isoform X2 n=1 Tax=Ostrea edulis TaxID=37623 RepID=UPI00209486EA|nr:protein YIF1B-A-like isoform X2 [Ostrea edulis]